MNLHKIAALTMLGAALAPARRATDYFEEEWPRCDPYRKAPEPVEFVFTEKPLTKRQKRRLRGKRS